MHTATAARLPSPLDCVIAGAVRFRADQCPPEVLDELRERMTLPNPVWTAAARAGAIPPRDTPKTLSVMVEDEYGGIEVPRGAVLMLRELLRAAGSDLGDVINRTTSPGGLDVRCLVEMRPHQLAAIDAAEKAVQGQILMPCGGGKTLAACGLIARLGQPALVLVHSHDLAEQWQGAIRRALGVEASIFAAGNHEIRPITIAMVQTLGAAGGEVLRAFGEAFGVVILDEAHHAPATSFRTILQSMPARYRFGLTATPERADGLHPFLEHCIGRVVYEVGQQELRDVGLLRAAHVEMVETAFEFEFPSYDEHSTSAKEDRSRDRAFRKAYDKCLRALVDDDARNTQIADLAARGVRQGHPTLVLTGRVEHVATLAELLRRRGLKPAVLHGTVKKPDRAAALDGLRDGSVRVVVATLQLADEGLDVPSLSRMVVCFPVATKGRAVQRIGRLMRPAPGKLDPVLYDLVDPGAGYWTVDARGQRSRRRPLAAMARTRAAAYQEALGAAADNAAGRA